MSTNITLPILSEIRGRKVTRDEVLRYEDRRIAAAAKKLGVPAPTRGDVDERRKSDYKDLSNLVTPSTRSSRSRSPV